ncbi:MAG TPA: tetratricopeptide repeat protein [Methanotrichaceae archaeon]|nr:tetratricopeptide repeat protein [Methanotrichaceae archaeon]
MHYRNRDSKSLKHLMIVIALAMAVIGAAWAQSMGGGGCYYNPRNPAEAYCSAHGGCPKSGNCYFPDGSFCELWSFYNGTCPGTGYIEQALWNAEVYAFLYGDDYNGYGYSGQNTGYNTGYGIGNAAYSASYWKSEADRYYLIGSYSEAVNLYSRAVQLDPSLAAAWLNLGNSLYFLSRYQESLAAYEAAIRLDPNNASAWQGRGQALLAQNRTDEAQDSLSRAEALMRR